MLTTVIKKGIVAAMHCSNWLEKRSFRNIPNWAWMGIPLTVYLLYMLLVYVRLRLNFISWHTHLAVYLYLWYGGAIVDRMISKKLLFKNWETIYSKWNTLLFALFWVEFFFVVSGVMKTYPEQISGRYASPNHPFLPVHYHTWDPKQRNHMISKGEYSYVFPTNSLGLPDMEWPVKKNIGEIRCLMLGDSFTEGDGAPYDSSYPALIRQKLLAAGREDIYLMNAGVCGSDPYYNFMDLKYRLLSYQPDIIIQAISSFDLLTDIRLRGGSERFLPDGTTQYQRKLWWEPIYAVSYISRVVFKVLGYNELLLKGEPSEREIREMNDGIIQLFSEYARLCQQHNIQLIVLIRPDRGEIESKQYNFDFNPLLQYLNQQKDVKVLDLLPCYLSSINKANETVNSFFWKIDGHHNSKGYELMANCIFEFILQNHLAQPQAQ
jgi:lysophospholipase L1-like esterase